MAWLSAPLAAGGALASAAAAASARSPAARWGLVAGAAGLTWYAWRALSGSGDDKGGAVGVLGRLLGGQPHGGEVPGSRPAHPGDIPEGRPATNLAHLTGAVLDPVEGELVRRALWADTYPVDVLVANQGDSTQRSRLRLDVREDGVTRDASETVWTEPYELAPGEARVFTVRVPALIGLDLALPGSGVPVELVARYAGFRVASARYERTT